MNFYVIYARPKDFPDHFVVRLHTVPGGATAIYSIFQTLDQARRYLPNGLIRLKRAKFDEPQIVEVWL